MRFLAIDYGSKRVGIALSDPSGDFALPYAVFPNDKKLISSIASLCHEQEVGTIIIGESKDYKGVDNPIMKKVLLFKEELENQTKLPVVLEPEYLTSAEAERLQGKNDMIDASAAALILKSYLDKRHNDIN